MGSLLAAGVREHGWGPLQREAESRSPLSPRGAFLADRQKSWAMQRPKRARQEKKGQAPSCSPGPPPAVTPKVATPFQLPFNQPLLPTSLQTAGSGARGYNAWVLAWRCSNPEEGRLLKQRILRQCEQSKNQRRCEVPVEQRRQRILSRSGRGVVPEETALALALDLEAGFLQAGGSACQ